MRILGLLCALLLINAPAAHAGGWAATYLDPVPSFQPSVTHTVGYWVLQHGSHPFSGQLGDTGLKFTNGRGTQVFKGVALGEPAHHAVTFTLPAGTYEVYGVQGIFADHHVGTLTVPGTLLVKPVDPQMVLKVPKEAVPWGSIAPPTIATETTVQPAAVRTTESPAEPVSVWWVGAVVVAAAGLFLVLRRRRAS